MLTQLHVLPQALRNPCFTEPCDGCDTHLAGWTISWASAGVRCGLSDDPKWPEALCISSGKDGVGFVEQAIPLEHAEELRMVTVTARIGSRDLKGKGAGLNVAAYDSAGTMLFTKDMGYGHFSWIHGTREGSTCRIQAVCPAGASTLRVGAIVYGAGTAWFDDFTCGVVRTNERRPDARARAYVGAACDTIARRSLRRDSIDLPALRAQAERIAGDAGKPEDHHLAVEFLLGTLGDHHSFLMKPSEVAAWQGDEEDAPAAEQATHRVIERMGYVSVPGFNSNDSLRMRAFADTIQQALAAMEAAGVRGWIVDLRNNTGGNMGPMVCGLGPLLDTGTLGQLVDVDGRPSRWWYRDGAYGWDDELVMSAPHPVTLPTRKPVAVLIGPRTGSSGECTAISFVGNARTRLFGQPTWGITTGNGEFDLPDGAKMFLASTVMADRNGHLFHGPVEPDERVEEPTDRKYDAALDAALTWIRAEDGK